MNSKQLVESYLYRKTWKVEENSNAPFSFGAMQRYFGEEVAKDYWLNVVYPSEIADAHRRGDFHIHDLGGLTLYCCGYSLKQIIQKGVRGIPNIPRSKPAKHFLSIINHIVNLATIFQNEIKGAVAFNSVDTLLAPFVRVDNLTYQEVKQNLQNLIFSLNSNSRMGAEPAFTNMTFDLTPPRDLKNEKVWVGGEQLDFTYGECQKEMDMINKAFFELMLEGDADGRPFGYPIPTYNIHEDFDWDNPNLQGLWEMAGKYGYPYFANFINSDLQVEDVRSMCCRLNLDLRELRKRNGGLFGSADSTGSIGVVTINMPRIAYESRGDMRLFYEILEERMELAKESLEIKRKWLQKNVLDTNLIPAYMEYVGTLNNHFSTIGVIGLNEMCENMLGCSITDERGKAWSIEVLNFMRDKLADFQEETGNLYNLEATPAEGCTYRLAKKDLEQYPDIITQGTKDAPYYTNSCHMPVYEVESVKQLVDHQEDLQVLFTGGTVVHFYLAGPISARQAKHTVRTVCENYRIPYISLSPLNAFCDKHGMVDHDNGKCVICGSEVELYQRVTGYIRKVRYFNKGKKSEFRDRRQLVLE